MINKDIVDWLKKGLAMGHSHDLLKKKLLEAGWEQEDVEKAIKKVKPGKPKLSSVLLIIFVLLIISLIAFGVYIYNNENKTFPAYKNITDCGINVNCLIDNSEGCNKAKIVHIQTNHVLDMLQTTTSYWEIKGFENNKCVFYIETKYIDMEFNKEIIEQMLESGLNTNNITSLLQKANEEYDKKEGLNLTCCFNNTEELSDLLTIWNSEGFSVTNLNNTECYGSMLNISI
ncbi:hypothetical protein JW949_04540 [Candidatus Woesearchaeota archaeon]|nr:hypothetical protein [Candidatus Woesearchaeota archaeon]